MEAFKPLAQEGDLEGCKAFISSNVDLVPPKLFLRCLTSLKLSYQYKGNLKAMEETKQLRDSYIGMLPLFVKVIKCIKCKKHIILLLLARFSVALDIHQL